MLKPLAWDGWAAGAPAVDGGQCVHTSCLDQPHLACCHASLLCCRANPYGEHYLDGISLNPFEVLFVKARRSCCITRPGLQLLAGSVAAVALRGSSCVRCCDPRTVYQCRLALLHFRAG